MYLYMTNFAQFDIGLYKETKMTCLNFKKSHFWISQIWN